MEHPTPFAIRPVFFFFARAGARAYTYPTQLQLAREGEKMGLHPPQTRPRPRQRRKYPPNPHAQEAHIMSPPCHPTKRWLREEILRRVFLETRP